MIINGGSISANLKGGVVSGSSQVNSLFIGTAVSTSLDSRLDTIEGPFSTSVDTRLDSLETDTHTHANKAQLDTINQNLATTSNVTFNTGSFTGDMTITGDLTVLGAATEISSTELKIEDKLITVASGSADSAAADGAGIEIDGAGKSLQWDHNTTSFVFDAKVSSSVGFKGEGGELTGIDTDQVTEGSNLYYTDTRVKTKINSDGVISGSIQLHTDLDARYLEINGDNVVSGSSQIDADQTTGWVADVRKQIDNVGLISGSVQVNANTITNFDANVKQKMTDEVAHSGSFLGTATTSNLSEHSSNLYYTDARVKTKLDAETVVSGSAQIQSLLPSGTVSGSAQSVSHITSGDLDMGGNKVLFGNVYTNEGDLPNAGTYHGMFAHVHNTGRGYFAHGGNWIPLVNLSDGTFSGSAQVDADQTTGWVADVRKQIDNVGLISGSSQVNANTITNFDANVKAKLDAETVVSGSSFASNHQGSITASINGTATNVDLGLNTDDSPTFTTLTLANVAAGGSTDFDALFNVGGLTKKRTIGTAAFLNVSASIADDPNSIPTTKAVNDALVEAGAGDITSVNTSNLYPSASTGIAHTSQGTVDGSGRFGNVGNVVLAIDTGSAHFVDAVQGISPSLPSGVISGSAQITALGYSTTDNELTTEEVQDIAGALIATGGTKTGIAVTYDDANNNMDFVVTFPQQTANDFTNTLKSKLDNIEENADVTDAANVLTSLPAGTVSGSSQISGITNTQLAGSIANSKLSNSAITISGTSVSLGSSITDETLFGGVGVVSGSSQIDIHSTDGYVANENIDHSSISVGSGKGLSGGGTIDTNRSIFLDTGSAHFDDGIKKIIDGDGVISGSSQIASDISGSFTSVSASLDNRLDTLEGDVHENVLTFNDTSTIDLNRSTNTITANVIGGIFSGSSQIAAGGDISGNVNSLTVGKVQGVALTSGEATQLATIGTSTISATQWGYLGGMDQDVKTTSNVTFASASLSNVTISGNLKVLGDSVEIAVSDLKIEDKLITVASGSSDSAAADGAGIEIAGANESITWNHGSSRFDISDDIHVTGTIKASDDIIAFASSDIELKNNIKPIDNPLEKIKSISGNSFDWNEEKQDIYKGKDYGVIAQEIEQILPELVVTRENGYKAVKYDKLVSLLIEGIKDLSKQVDELKNK